MKNYYFNKKGKQLDNITITDTELIHYLVINDVRDFKEFCDDNCMTDEGVIRTGVYQWNENEWLWDIGFIPKDIYNKLSVYLNDETTAIKETKEEKLTNTPMLIIEFTNGNYIETDNGECSLKEILLAIEEMSVSPVFKNKIKSFNITMN